MTGAEVPIRHGWESNEWRYVPMTWDPSSLPQNLPAASALLPEERRARKASLQAEQDAARVRRAEAEAADRRTRGGFFNKLHATVRPSGAKARTSITSTRFKREEKNHASRERKFNGYFRFPNGQEHLIWQSKRLRLANGFTSVVGKLYISENWLCFRESKMSMRRSNRNFILQLPLAEIVTLQRAQAVKPPNASTRLEFQLKHDLGSFADSLLVYTRDSCIHQFWSFWSNENFEDTFNSLDCVWRTRVLGMPRRVPEATVAPVPLTAPISTAVPAAATLPAPAVGMKPSQIYADGLNGKTAPMVQRLNIINTAHATFVPEGVPLQPNRAIPMTSTFVPAVSGGTSLPVSVLNDIRGFSRSFLRPAITVEARYVVVMDNAVHKRHHHRRHHAHRKERPGILQTFDASRSTGLGVQSKLPQDLLLNIRGFNKQGLRHVLPRVSYEPVGFDVKSSALPARVSRGGLVPESPGARYWMSKRDNVVRAVRQEKPHLRHVQPLEKHGLSMSEEYNLSMPRSQAWRKRTLPDALARDIIMFNSTGLQRLRHIGGPMERPIFDQIPTLAEYRKRAWPGQILGQIRNFPRQSMRHVQVPERTQLLKSLYRSRDVGAGSSQWTLKQPGGLGEITLKGWLLWPSALRNQLRSFDHTRLKRVGPRVRPTWDVIPEEIERQKPLGRYWVPASNSFGYGMPKQTSTTVITSVYSAQPISGPVTAKATFVPAPQSTLMQKSTLNTVSASPRTSRLGVTRSSPLAPRRGL